MSSILRYVTQLKLTTRTSDERPVVEDRSPRNEDFKVLAFEVLGRESYVSFLDARLNFCQVL